jgi:hypothetical protein
MNIFYNHWLKRDGAIYKDLAFMGHNERINYLQDFIKDCEYYISLNHKNKKFKKEIVIKVLKVTYIIFVITMKKKLKY